MYEPFRLRRRVPPRRRARSGRPAPGADTQLIRLFVEFRIVASGASSHKPAIRLGDIGDIGGQVLSPTAEAAPSRRLDRPGARGGLRQLVHNERLRSASYEETVAAVNTRLLRGSWRRSRCNLAIAPCPAATTAAGPAWKITEHQGIHRGRNSRHRGSRRELHSFGLWCTEQEQPVQRPADERGVSPVRERARIGVVMAVAVDPNAPARRNDLAVTVV